MVQSRFSSKYHCCNVFEYLRFHQHFVLQSCCLLYVSETNKREILWRSDVSKTLRPPCGASKMIVFIIKREILISSFPKTKSTSDYFVQPTRNKFLPLKKLESANVFSLLFKDPIKVFIDCRNSLQSIFDQSLLLYRKSLHCQSHLVWRKKHWHHEYETLICNYFESD